MSQQRVLTWLLVGFLMGIVGCQIYPKPRLLILPETSHQPPCELSVAAGSCTDPATMNPREAAND